MRRLKTVRRPPIYPNGAQAISPVAPSPLFRCPHAVHRCPSVDSGLGLQYLTTGDITIEELESKMRKIDSLVKTRFEEVPAI